jgi:DNA-binding transcriptional MerR regulator
MKDTSYQHKDIITIFPDLSPRSLVSWAEKEILIPEHSDARGRGTVRKYSFDNVLQAGIIRELMSLGLTFRDIKTFVTDHWKKEMKKFEYGCVLIVQRHMFGVDLGKMPDKRSSAFVLKHRFDVRVFSIGEFEDYGTDIIFGTSTYTKNNRKLVPIGKSSTISSVLVVNVEKIYHHVINELKRSKK